MHVEDEDEVRIGEWSEEVVEGFRGDRSVVPEVHGDARADQTCLVQIVDPRCHVDHLAADGRVDGVSACGEFRCCSEHDGVADCEILNTLGRQAGAGDELILGVSL